MLREDCRETSTLACVCERGRESGLAYIAFGIRREMRRGTGLSLVCHVESRGERYAMVLDLIMGRILLVLLKVRLH